MLADQALDRHISTFCQLYTYEGWPSETPEQLLLALGLWIWRVRPPGLSAQIFASPSSTCCQGRGR
jgi:hypothetical protein